MSEPDDRPSGPARLRARRVHALAIRWSHWLNVPLLALMLWTGLRIYNANDVHAIDLLGIRFHFFPDPVYELLDADRRLAKGIAYHLTLGWLFALNGLVYLTHLAVTGGWRRLVPDRAALRDLPAVIAHDLHLRRHAPVREGYNAAQRLAYTAVVSMGVIMILTGFAIYKPVQLRPLVTLLGGYGTARLIHFTTALAIVAFIALHLVQVVRSGWRNASAMVTGYLVEAIPGPAPADGDDGDAGSHPGTDGAAVARSVPEPTEREVPTP